jgi:hypothetical protein
METELALRQLTGGTSRSHLLLVRTCTLPHFSTFIFSSLQKQFKQQQQQQQQQQDSSQLTHEISALRETATELSLHVLAIKFRSQKTVLQPWYVNTK